MSALDELKSMREKRNELAKQIKDNAKKLFKEAVHTLFEEYPILIKFGWTQYTPYFNDGDTCEFGSNHTSPSIWFHGEDGVDEDDSDGDLYDHEFYEHKYEKTWDAKKSTYVKNTAPLSEQRQKELVAGKAVIEFMRNFEEDDMLAMFGDHQMVIVTPKKVISEEYEHE